MIVFVAIMTPFINIFFRCIGLSKYGDGTDDSSHNKEERPKISIIITAQDNETELEQNLPALFSQEYEPGFEVVVVTSKSEDDTDTVLKNIQKAHSNLYTTFIPDSSRYMSRMKLAVTLGVKAAKNEWVVLLSPQCRPRTDQWLNTLSGHCRKGTDMVIGYANYTEDAKGYCRFHRLHHILYNLRVAVSNTAYCSTGGNVAFRKSVFMKHNGFLKNLKYERGEFDFIVNEYAKRGNTDVCIENQARLSIDTPSSKSWLNSRLYYMETRRHLHRTHIQRLKFNTDLLFMHLNYLLQIGGLVYFGLTKNWLGLGVSAFALIYTLVIRMIIANKVIKRFGENIKIYAIPIYELRLIWSQLYIKLKYKIADKSTFIRK